MSRTISITASIAAALLMAGSGAWAADSKAEIVTAAQHAELAANSASLEMVHMHLHHAVNCLEGPDGADFSKADVNPCQNSGVGAIPDSKDPGVVASLRTALAQALKGIASSDLAGAQSDAAATAQDLKQIP